MEEQVVLSGTVKTIAAYGAFVELEGGVTGLVHISQLTEGRVDNVESAVSVSLCAHYNFLIILAGTNNVSPTLRWSEAGRGCCEGASLECQ